jgi:hypothetical protein
VNEFLSGDPRGGQTTLQNAPVFLKIIRKIIYIGPISSLFVKTLEKLDVASSVFRLLQLLSIQNPKSSILPLTSSSQPSGLSPQVSAFLSPTTPMATSGRTAAGQPYLFHQQLTTDNQQPTTDNQQPTTDN